MKKKILLDWRLLELPNGMILFFFVHGRRCAEVYMGQAGPAAGVTQGRGRDSGGATTCTRAVGFTCKVAI